MMIMKKIYWLGWELFHIVFRHFLFPCKLGLRTIGHPDENSPIFLSGNYTLTVYRLCRMLTKHHIACYLLVANSRGSNVWCAAGMNEYNAYDVLDALHVTGLEKIVTHRTIIAPPYAAVSIDLDFFREQTGFNIKWGPTHLRDIPRYVQNNFQRTEDMLEVQFGLRDRLEQATAGAAMLALNFVLLLPFFPKIVAGISLFLVTAYFLQMFMWNILPEERYFVRSIVFTLLLHVLLAVGLYFIHATSGEFLVWHGILLLVCFQLAADIQAISTPYKTSLTHWMRHGNYESLFQPIIHPAKCTGCRRCLFVCPRKVLAKNSHKKAVAVAPQRCIGCLACVKQCRFEAVYNASAPEYKHDIYTIPNLDALMTREVSDLQEEKRWIGQKTTFQNDVLTVVEG